MLAEIVIATEFHPFTAFHAGFLLVVAQRKGPGKGL